MANYGKCTVCGYKGNRDKDDLCYRPECKKAREKAAKAEKTGLISKDAETSVSGQDEQPMVVGENGAEMVRVGQNHSGEPTNMVPDLPEDLDRPFHFGGFDFGPAPHRRMVGSHLAAITAKSLSLRTGVINEHDLGRYDYARIAVSTDGKALAVKFYTDKRPGARKIQLKRRSHALIAMEPLVAQHPEWIGREAVLEPMGVEGWFLMRVGEEAA
ncbi:MAG: hypothetical protein AB7D37_11160 [Desulfovibrio sp.]